MAKVENLDLPVSWLIDPHKKWAIHFDSKKETFDRHSADFTIDMWGLDANGQPMQFKSRRKATKKDLLKTWKQLISSNWTELDSEKVKLA